MPTWLIILLIVVALIPTPYIYWGVKEQLRRRHNKKITDKMQKDLFG